MYVATVVNKFYEGLPIGRTALLCDGKGSRCPPPFFAYSWKVLYLKMNNNKPKEIKWQSMDADPSSRSSAVRAFLLG